MVVRPGLLRRGAWQLHVGDTTAALEAKPLELLQELLMRAGEVVTRQELLEAVWPGVIVAESSLFTAVRKLRRALNDDRGELLEPVPRIGDRLAGPAHV